MLAYAFIKMIDRDFRRLCIFSRSECVKRLRLVTITRSEQDTAIITAPFDHPLDS